MGPYLKIFFSNFGDGDYMKIWIFWHKARRLVCILVGIFALHEYNTFGSLKKMRCLTLIVSKSASPFPWDLLYITICENIRPSLPVAVCAVWY